MNNLDKQYTDLICDAYKNYLIEDAKILPNMSKEKMTELCYRLTQEEFINKIKTDEVFAKKWGFQVYTRELKHKERIKLAWSVFFPDRKNESVPDWWNVKGLSMDEKNIPTRAISLTYNTQTIEIYE